MKHTVAIFRTAEGDSVAVRDDGMYSTIFGTDIAEWEHYGFRMPWCRCRFLHTDTLLAIISYEEFVDAASSLH